VEARYAEAARFWVHHVFAGSRGLQVWYEFLRRNASRPFIIVDLFRLFAAVWYRSTTTNR